ncbi:hypothetical protein TorRG33x02_259510 [Trema orientale]|uniref:Uncharacterized protein n=1 Tax=Trema orientale TaxID=63057 RepID=A0A2P5D7W1_TREOI|nr:hypothetical protein TorRG33x02_259510 [Trema orientale]
MEETWKKQANREFQRSRAGTSEGLEREPITVSESESVTGGGGV